MGGLYDPTPAPSGGLLGALGQTWPPRLAQGLLGGLTAPSDGQFAIGNPMGEAYPPQGGNAVQRTAGHFAQGLANWLGTPGRAVNEGLTPEDATNWGAGTALMMLGASRFPGGAPAGALGAAGSKLVQPEGIRAYHGSPHDFNQFDLAKIGSGEGAQAYGHGLYFAEKEATAKSYRDALADYNYRDPSTAAAAYLKQAGGNRDLALSRMREMALEPVGVSHQEAQGIRGGYQLLKSGQPLPELGAPGRMYEVNINAHPDQFLNWDKPLAAQGAPGQALQDVVPKPNWMQRQIEGMPVIRHDIATNPESTGGTAYGALSRMIGQDKATAALREAGVPGIRYLDQGSRAAGDGSRNYVVFDPSLIEIMRKYGLAGLASTGAAGGLLPNNQPQQ